MTASVTISGKRILVGEIMGAFGVRGEVKIRSHTEPETAIFRYQPWLLRDARGNERALEGVRGRSGAKGVVAQLPGVEDRDASEALRGTEIYVPREALPPPKPGEYYWVDLEGLRVETVGGVPLGILDHVFATGANDVLAVRGDRERLIPFIQPDVVTQVDFDTGVITVDWDPDF
ncbi:ribosome maturation factor RimM [Solilutibacter tolerans]|uniref:Ribosome maturation factor RimM n=1 Tax=Solilutibacter tolerans TaxID=1604334 RepID=A0A1N6T8F2_9GAMM|nr:ribosome maturation factor RimM [Lysobacter tolerans]SIQ49386.1 16S rRNA processing protein RimM [Lysobacter tolerans]